MDPDGLDTACQLTGATVQLAFRHLNQILIVKININSRLNVFTDTRSGIDY